MGNLNIENATIGFDANNIQTALNNLNTHVIQDAVTALKANLSELRSSVDGAWVGQSAEIFKSNLDYDANEIQKKMNDAYDALKATLNSIASDMSTIDESLVERHG